MIIFLRIFSQKYYTFGLGAWQRIEEYAKTAVATNKSFTDFS